jgi:hypothetical protein
MDGGEIPKIHKERDLRSGFQVVGNSQWAMGRLSGGRFGSEQKVIDSFAEADIPEVITVEMAPGGITFGQLKPDSVKASEPLIAIAYETTADSRKGHNGYLDGFGRHGNKFYFVMYLPKSDGEQLVSAIQTDPGIIREAGDILMRDVIGATVSWDEARPPFEQWEAANGGLNRIALRSDASQLPAQSKVLEF